MNKTKWILLVIAITIVLSVIGLQKQYNARIHRQTLNNGTILDLNYDEVYIYENQEVMKFRQTEFCRPFLEHMKMYPSNLPQILINECVVDLGEGSSE